MDETLNTYILITNSWSDNREPWLKKNQIQEQKNIDNKDRSMCDIRFLVNY